MKYSKCKAQVFQIEYVLHNEGAGKIWHLENAIFDNLESPNFQNFLASPKLEPRNSTILFSVHDFLQN
jgi:hypothetical protein